MCGLVGVISSRPAAPLILDSLRRLEYRGYDSAGIATLVNGHIERRRAKGKIANLAVALTSSPLVGTTGIGHTRWATHGAPTESNAHPHATSRVAVVHNGIIENHATLREEMEAAGRHFTTETDTEAVVQLLDLNLAGGMSPREAVLSACQRLKGSYALAIVFAGHPDLLIGVQNGAPLAIGFGGAEMYVGSDALALAPLTSRMVHLREGEWAELGRHTARFFDFDGQEIKRDITVSALADTVVGKGPFRHYMDKELHEHPRVIHNTLQRMIDPAERRGLELPFDITRHSRITISACGSAFYAGLVGRSWFEQIARIPTDADIASEFRYRAPPLEADGLGILVSQSGETADTLAALKFMREQKQRILSIVNVPESSIARGSDIMLETRAGPEMSVASTKAFTAQLAMLACLAIGAAVSRGSISPAEEAAIVGSLLDLPDQAQAVLDCSEVIEDLARLIVGAQDVLYLARGNCFPIALEGALKLKEITYIHAEGYAAGEMKHGPIALIDNTVPVIAIAPSGPLLEKTASNLQEAAARGGQVIVFGDRTSTTKLRGIASRTIVLPTVHPIVAPVLYAIAVQMLAYHVAVLKGTDVDQPRNLAKSVTVE